MSTPKLLVSIRNVDEAQVALGCAVDLIDIKEPTQGALGACDLETITAIACAVGGRIPVSAALGELRDFVMPEELLRLDDVRFAKFGLAGMAHSTAWQDQLQSAWVALPARVSPVVVAYADFEAAESPTPEEVIGFACQSKCGAVLIDTFLKNGANVLSHLSVVQLRKLYRRVHGTGKLFVVGGSLELRTIPKVARLGVDYIAVRGAACKYSRTSEIDAEQIAKIAQLLAQPTVESNR